MCGRYVVAYYPDDFSERYQLRVIPETLFRSFNAAPTQSLPVIVERPETGREVAALRWGLVPRWSKPGEAKPVAPFNARAESVASKPMFRNLFKKKRCLVPVNGYYEWKTVGGKKQPYLFTLPDEPMFSLAGLYDDTTDREDERAPWGSYTVITTTPNEFTGEFHSRMPVIIAREDEEEWLSPAETDVEPLERLLRPYPAEAMAARRVSAAVNNVRNNNESLIEPQDDEPLVPGSLL